jgi:PDZ domain-containing protein
VFKLKRVRPLHLALGGLALAAITFLIMWQVSSESFLLLPDRAHPVAPLVSVQGGHEPKGPGGIYFVDVLEQRASLLEAAFPSIHTGASLVPASRIVPPGTTDAQQRQADLRQMAMSQKVAAAVALRAAGYNVTAVPTGVLVDSVIEGSDAVGKLQPTDAIVALDGKPIRTITQLHAALGRLKVGDVAHVGVRRGSKLTTVSIRTTATKADPHTAILGLFPEQATNIHLPISVRIQAGNVGGPSAGLPFALEVLEELGRNVDRGHRVAATGELLPDGTVVPIGGVEQKTYGARMAHVDVFLVPAGDNYLTARRYAHGLRIIPVHSFQQALRALATLPLRR